MSGPPPGYNPGESMLQGGNSAAIHPVMGGGGGALPAGFENQSLLRGGETAAIHPVQGGGAGTAVTTPITIAKSDSALTIPTKEDHSFIEFNKTLEESMKQLATYSGPYVLTQRDTLWKRYNPTEPNAVERPPILATDNCATPSSGRLDDEKGEGGFDRLAMVLPKATAEILLFPPVRSSRRAFYACLEYLKEIKMMDASGNMEGPVAKGSVVGGAKKMIVFAPPFFLLDARNIPGYLESNKKLIAHFMKLKAQYPHMYILTQSSHMNKMIGNCMASAASSAPLLNMLEPTYIVYPYARVQEELDPDDPLKVVNKAVGGIVFSAAGANEVILPASNNIGRASPSVYIQKGQQGGLAYPPNTKKEDKEINPFYNSLKLRFYGEGAETMLSTEVRQFIVQPSPKDAADGEVDDKIDIFKAADEANLALDDMIYTRVPLDGRIYSFRAPGAPGVVNDWKAGRFTTDEAEFLNQLQLRPKLLVEIFQEDGGLEVFQRLARFLENMARGRCFTDERLLTASECQESRDFVNRVYNYYLMHDTRLKELKEEEEAARRRAARLRIQSAEGRMRSAEQAERETIKQLQDEKTNILAKAKMVGIDVSKDESEYNKDPSAVGGPVERLGLETLLVDPTGVVGGEPGKPPEYIMQVIVFKRKTADYYLGRVKFTATDTEDKRQKAIDALKALNKAYPGYYIVRDFNNK
jgi:hypothetical protein